MMEHTYTVRADWDGKSGTWVGEGTDVRGLVTGADTFEALMEKLRVMMPEMLEAIGVLSAGRRFPGDSKIKSRHLANFFLKLAGLPKQF